MNWWALGIIVVAVAITFFDQWAKSDRREAVRRDFWDVPEKSIAAVKDGELVRLKGRAFPREPLRTSPISELECIGVSLTIERHDTEDEWKEVVDQDDFVTFVVADGTGEAVLHGPFDVRLPPQPPLTDNSLPRAVVEILALRDEPRTDLFGFDKHFRYVETVLLPGQEIFAVGRATFEIDPAGRSPSRRDPPVMCHLKGVPKPVIIADVKEPFLFGDDEET